MPLRWWPPRRRATAAGSGSAHAYEQALEAAVIDVEGAAEAIRLVSTAAFGKWRDHRNILLTRTKSVRVQSRNDIPAILDGEKINLGRSAEINFVPKAVTVLVPASR